MINRLSYWDENTELSNKFLLNFEQMSERKYHSVIDAVINLTHDIQLANVNNNIISYLLLNIKEAFDHVSLQ